MSKLQPGLDWRFGDEEDADGQLWPPGDLAHTTQEGELASAPGRNRWRRAAQLWPALLLVLFGAFLWRHNGSAAAPHKPAPFEPATAAASPPPSQACASNDNGAAWLCLEQTLATRYFVYRFHPGDATSVARVAPRLDAFYNTLRQDLGLPPPGGRITITVALVAGQPLHRYEFYAGSGLIVPSPDLLQNSFNLPPATLLHQSLVYVLGEQVLLEKFAGDYSRPSPADPFATDWPPLARALRLWQLWHSGGPLAALRQELVAWLYTGEELALPASYRRICDLHEVWQLPPLHMSIPLTCTSLDPLERREPPLDLVRLSVMAGEPGQFFDEAEQRAHVIALATMLEYVAATYGREQLPVLIDRFQHTAGRQRIAPEVFGVTPDAFQEGWRRYLAIQYGVSP